jgi:hypothetical protein
MVHVMNVSLEGPCLLAQGIVVLAHALNLQL